MNILIKTILQKKIALVSALLLVCGCSAMLVPLTFNPYKKLAQANNLLEMGRPLPAEQLIREAVSEFQTTGDNNGNALANRVYGVFFKSDAVVRWANYYGKNGFLDKTVDYSRRLHKSNDYFRKAAGFYSDLKSYGELTNVYLNIGWNFEALELKSDAREAFALARQAYHDNLKQNPGKNPITPSGYQSLDQYIDELISRNK
jgi:tetratricopeptide (TPR) repeat protein